MQSYFDFALSRYHCFFQTPTSSVVFSSIRVRISLAVFRICGLSAVALIHTHTVVVCVSLVVHIPPAGLCRLLVGLAAFPLRFGLLVPFVPQELASVLWPTNTFCRVCGAVGPHASILCLSAFLFRASFFVALLPLASSLPCCRFVASALHLCVGYSNLRNT